MRPSSSEPGYGDSFAKCATCATISYGVFFARARGAAAVRYGPRWTG